MRYGYGVKFLIIIVLYLAYTSYKREPFTTKISTVQVNYKERNLILLGDSTLKNNKYVKQINTVEYVLRQKTNGPVHCLARDGATITDVYNQINDIPTTLNNKDNIIFLSIGGNDILKKTTLDIDALFIQYERLLTKLINLFDKCRIVLLNLYTPPNINKLKKNDSITDKITQWNTALNKSLYNNNISIIDLHTLLYEPSDFVSGYEPSEVGGHKIAMAIINKL
jgi:hypothetical protein